MEYRPTRAARRDLAALAQTQGGYFTAKQAAQFGYQPPHLAYHVGVGNFERAGHGVYRLPELPFAEHDDLVRLSLWSRGRDDQPQAVVSHQTALAIYDLSDLLPTKNHLTVPLSFRKPAPKGVVLYRAELSTGDIQEREGFFITTPLRTLVDAASDASVGAEHVERAIAQALARGMVRKASLEQALATCQFAANLADDR